MINYSASVKTNKGHLDTKIWVNLRNIILGEKNKLQKFMYSLTFSFYEFKND